MKKIFTSVLAIAAIAACTKSEVQYETPGEIGFAPAVKNITKAAITDGVYPEQPLRVYANYGTVEANTPVDATASNFTTGFLANALFVKKTVGSVIAWGGEGNGYTWPNNGSLIFAGYSVPNENEIGTASYDFKNDKLTITGYTQSTSTDSTFDLGWFGRTSTSYNYRNNSTNTVPVTLSHALSWIEIQVKGEGTTITEGNPWTITSIVMNNVANTGNVTCVGSGANKASWTNLGTANNSITIYSGTGLPLSGTAAVCEDNTAGTLVIPQTPSEITPDDDTDTEVATLTIKYTYKTSTGAQMPDQTTTVALVVKEGEQIVGWKSGYKYIYTLTFKANEILIAPSYGAWDSVNQGVTVE